MRHYALYAIALVLLIGCKPASPPTTSSASSATAIPPSLGAMATPSDKHDIADLLRNPPASGRPIEIDAYFSGATTIPHPGGFPPPSDQIACPSFYEAALTDRPFLADLTVLNSIGGNILPDNAPWLIAVTPDMLKPGVWQLPQLPYHARLRGHLGESVLAHCEHADRIFLVEQVVQVYADKYKEKPEESSPYLRQLPDDYATWSRYHNTSAGFSLSYPSDWQIDQVDDVTWNLRSPQWPDLPLVVRVHGGETHLDQYDSTSMPPLLQGTTSFGVYEQGGGFNGAIDSQRLDGYQVSHDEDPTERSVSVLFSGSGHTYELALRYPLGFDAPQPLLTAYSVIVEGFRLDVRPGPSPTPPVGQVLGAGPFLSKDEALARVRDSEGRVVTLLGAKLVPEAEARQSADACNTFESHPDGVWTLTVRGVFENQTRTMRMYLDATTGEQLCGEEIILNATPWPTLPPYTTATPVPAPTSSTHLPVLPDGRLLLLRGDAPPYELWMIRSDGADAEQLPIAGLELKDDVIPSPDGKRLLLIRSNDQGHITRRRLDIYDLAKKRMTTLVDAASTMDATSESTPPTLTPPPGPPTPAPTATPGPAPTLETIELKGGTFISTSQIAIQLALAVDAISAMRAQPITEEMITAHPDMVAVKRYATQMETDFGVSTAFVNEPVWVVTIYAKGTFNLPNISRPGPFEADSVSYELLEKTGQMMGLKIHPVH